MHPFPRTIAIAGAWGYIGRKFLAAASALGLRCYAYDPGPVPEDVDLRAVERIGGDEAFYRAEADIFHLAVHPEDRLKGEHMLLARSADESLLMLNEKPMAAPECPQRCPAMVDAVQQCQATVLYDFPELYDALTERIIGYLSRFRDVQIAGFQLCRSKDREDPNIARNHKRMVTIQYQESVHCLAFVVYVLGKLRGGLARVLDDGVSITARSDPYRPPNPEIYAHAVDGRCEYTMSIGATRIDGTTDFKAGASWAKRRAIWGTADGAAFRIEADYLEGEKRLAINGVDQPCDPKADSYQQVITTASRWYRQVPRARLMHDLYPNPSFARVTYQLSSALWRSCRDRRTVHINSLDDLLAFHAGFAAEPSSEPSTE